MSSTMICANAETAAVSSDHGREGTPDARRASRARVGRAAARGPAPASSCASRLDRSKGRSCVRLRIPGTCGEHEDDGHDGMGAAHERRLCRRHARAPAGRARAPPERHHHRAGSCGPAGLARARDARWVSAATMSAGATHDDGRRGRRPRAALVGRVGARRAAHAAHARRSASPKKILFLAGLRRSGAWVGGAGGPGLGKTSCVDASKLGRMQLKKYQKGAVR
jgi:hypothetical protein